MDVREALRTYTGKKYVYFVERGNKAIYEALKIAKESGKNKVLIPDQGGWLTYQQYPAKLNMFSEGVKTKSGVFDLSNLKEKLSKECVVLVNSMPAYSTYENMEMLVDVCHRFGAMVINDVSGSIGKIQARYGDIIVGSFGKWKPICIEKGGFIALDEQVPINEVELDEVSLAKAIKGRGDRVQKWINQVKKIKNDLREFDVLHKDSEGFVVIVKYKSQDEKQKIIDYCEGNNLIHKECPRYIRVMEDAISIEVKNGEEN